MDNKFIKISQFNVQSIRNKKPLLIEFLDANKIDICLVNETWLKENTSFYIPGFDFINQNGLNGRGGAGILIKNNFKYSVVSTPFYSFLQSVAITVHTNIGKLTILCVYSPPDNSPYGKLQCTKLKQIINSLSTPLLISGDLNAHHVAFGCLTSSSRGDQIYDMLDECDLCILNTGTPTTVGTPRHNSSAIDISCVSPSLAPYCSWSVYNDPMGSYHYPTFIDIQTQALTYILADPVDRYLYAKANWARFTSETKKAFEDFTLNDNNPIESYNQFYKILCMVRDKYIPKYSKKTQHITKNPVPWWDSDCLQAVIKSKDALKLYQSNPTIDNYIQYKKVDAAKKKLISEKRSSSWRALCETFNRYTPIATVWNYIRKFKNISSFKSVKNDTWVDAFLDKYAPLSPPEKEIDNNLISSAFEQLGNENSKFLCEPFSWNEFSSVISNRKDSTPGLDDIPYMLIRHMHVDAQKVLLLLYNQLWQKQIIPDSWKTQCIVPILKPDKPSDDCNSYRPISLSSCIGKVFECMLKGRLEWYVESSNLIPDQQFGFRKGRSATQSFVSFVTDIKNSFYSHHNTVAAFLDVTGAFDNVNPTALVRVLADLGIPGKINKWIFNFLYERTMFVKFNNVLYGPRKVYKGTMQGATISPLLYNLYICQLNNCLKNENVQVLQFADDIVVYSVNKNVNIAINSVNSSLIKIHEFYYNKLLLNISPSKSGAVLFSRKYLEIPTNKIIYDNKALPWLKEKKFLGICLDQKLTFQNHINYIIKNASKGLNLLRSLAGVTWGSDPKVLSMLYKSIVRSHFDYSSVAYMNSNLTLLRKLDIIQNKALRIITGAMCSTPINSMECETCIVPLFLRRIQLAENFCLKLISSDNKFVMNRILPKKQLPFSSYGPYVDREKLLSKTAPELLRILIHMMQTCVHMYISNSWPKVHYNCLVNNNVDILQNNILNQADLLLHLDKMGNTYKLYTDGSKCNDRVTAAYYDPQMKVTKCFLLNKITTIYSAECYAIYQALIHIRSRDINVERAVIITDSKSFISTLQNKKLVYNDNYLIYKIKDLLDEMRHKGKVITFIWVPSHRGILGNEKADRAARNLHDEDHVSIMRIPYTDYNALMKKQIIDLWHNYYQIVSEDKGRWHADIQRVPPAQPWYHKYDFDYGNCCRRFVSIINRLKFGHCQVPTHLYKLKLIRNSKCTYCYKEEANLDHLIFKCSYFGIQRLLLVAELNNIEENFPKCLKKLLSEKRFYNPLYKYIVNTVGKI